MHSVLSALKTAPDFRVINQSILGEMHLNGGV